MKCPTCGGEMALSETICPQCHDPRPQWAPFFEETARRFADLKARFQAGQLDTASYEAALHELMVEHEGAFWTLGAEMEVWYRHDGTQWVQDTPPTLAPGEQHTLVGVRPVEVPTVKKGRRLPLGLLVGGAAALVILLALGALVAVLVVPPILVNKAIAQGNEALAAGKYTEAEAAFAEALEGEPGNAEANLGMGDTLSAQEKYAESIPYYQKALMADDDLANAHAGLAWAYYHTGEYEKAITGFTRLIALRPAEVEGHQGKGLSYYALERYEEALEPLEAWVEMELDSFDAHQLLGLAEYRLGNTDRALEHLNRAVGLAGSAEESKQAEVYYGLGGAYCQQGKGQECIAAYEKAEELDPWGKDALAEEEQRRLDEAYVENAMKDVLLDLDFSNIVTEEEETYAVARTGQKVKIEGAVHLVDGPWEGSQALAVEEGTTNYLPNPSMESGDPPTGWNAIDGSHSRSSSHAVRGSHSANASLNNVGNARWHSNQTAAGSFVSGDDCAFSVYLRGSGQVRLVIAEYDNSGYYLRESLSGAISLTDTWTRYTRTTTCGANCERVNVRVKRVSGSPSFYADAAMAEKKAYSTTYCDGDQDDGYSWSGAPHASPSMRTVTAANLDNYVSLISSNNTLSFRVVAQMPYNADATWPEASSYLFDITDGTNNNRIILDFATVEDKFRLYINSAYRIETDALTFVAGDWLDIVLTLDFSNNEHKMYINGELAGSSTASLSAPTGLTDWELGSRAGGTNRGNFTFAQFAVFNRPLTTNESAALYRVGVSVSQ